LSEKSLERHRYLNDHSISLIENCGKGSVYSCKYSGKTNKEFLISLNSAECKNEDPCPELNLEINGEINEPSEADNCLKRNLGGAAMNYFMDKKVWADGSPSPVSMNTLNALANKKIDGLLKNMVAQLNSLGIDPKWNSSTDIIEMTKMMGEDLKSVELNWKKKYQEAVASRCTEQDRMQVLLNMLEGGLYPDGEDLTIESIAKFNADRFQNTLREFNLKSLDAKKPNHLDRLRTEACKKFIF
jgi:hypothetical protein